MANDQDIPLVCFIDDLVRILGSSRRTIQRRRSEGRFPIPELPSIDMHRPRWSHVDVKKYLANERTRKRAA
jgi:predicted DNA-binding transcriptional regulator AlpA